jgi:hypothetical protein
MNPEISSVMIERGKVYGEPHLSHENIGLAWTGLIQQHYGMRLDHPLPSWLVEMMMASFKIHRASRVFHADNFLDCRAYLAFAEHGQQKPHESYQIPEPIESIHDR